MELDMSKHQKKKSSKKRIKICDTCGEDIKSNERRDALKFNDVGHQVLALEYCEDHETKYNGHKCKPSWCGDCTYLVKYEIEVNEIRMDKGE
jgi:hypothetical protein